MSVTLSLCAVVARAQEDDVQRYMRTRMEDLESDGKLVVQGTPIVAVDFVPKLYAHMRFKRVWTDPAKVKDLIRAIEDSAKDGLDPEDYGLSQIKALQGKFELSSDPTTGAELDMLLTDALAELGYHAFYGKVDPERIDQTWNFAQAWKGADYIATAVRMLNAKSLYNEIEALKPRAPMYDRFRRTLAKYRAYQAAGGWKPIASGPSLKVGMKDKRVPEIRHRLAISEDLPKAQDNGSDTYDEELRQGVERFQKRHRLPAGELARLTLDAMNVPVEKRIDQIRLNLERARWILRDVPERLVLVNAAAFEIYYMEKDKIVWQNRAQVGKTFSQTPQYRDDIQYLVLNPTWTVPPGVLASTVLPGAKANPGYIKEKNIRVIDPDKGEIEPSKVRWSSYTADNFPFVLRQDPGPDNALGAIKFMFPNQYHVYLHDTPNQTGYDARQRAMSWGCVHVFEPLELAEKLIANPQRWNLDALKKQVASKKSETVYLDKPVPVMLLYWTVSVNKEGVTEFIPDVYERDAKVLRALNQGSKVRKGKRRSDEVNKASDE
ncbi:MAG TPA: L,D-transpeptidase family protein [Polyangiales bacterium]|nr:L,D-transpeptidase family protein [Polyangiales bacterium]